MKRILIITAVVVFVVGGVVVSVGAGGSSAGKTYKIVFDNAFGLVKGADFKVGGVPVGSITDEGVTKDARALVTVSVSKSGFGAMRSDASCTVEPQSLIGEWFVDCQPGKKGKVLRNGATIPVKNTQSPIPPDLVLNVMRLPIRERFSIVLGELGAGLAARGNDVNATIRRAIPALGATNRVLKILGDNRTTLANLARESGQVLKTFGQGRQAIGDFVVQAKNASVASANRRVALAQTIHRFPGFLDQLTPTMRDLGIATRVNTPTLVDLRAAAPKVRRLLQILRPFSQALEPATVTLGKTSITGRSAALTARPLVRQLGGLGKDITEPANNLRIILNDLDNRKRSVEPDPNAATQTGNPADKIGYTGLEAPLQYIFDQSQAINIFDQRGYSLKINVNPDTCSNYTTADQAKADMARYRKCNQNLGPNQPGITTPDPSPPLSRSATASSASAGKSASPRSAHARRGAASGKPAATSTPSGKAGATPTPGSSKPNVALPPVQQLIDKLPQLVHQPAGKRKHRHHRRPGRRPTAPVAVPTVTAPGAPSTQSAQDLLDFLFSP